MVSQKSRRILTRNKELRSRHVPADAKPDENLRIFTTGIRWEQKAVCTKLKG